MKSRIVSKNISGYVAILIATCIFLVFSYHAVTNEEIYFSNKPLGTLAFSGWQKNVLGLCSLYIAAYFTALLYSIFLKVNVADKIKYLFFYIFCASMATILIILLSNRIAHGAA
jgi:hypothetical protein